MPSDMISDTPLRRSIVLRQQMRAAIDAELDERIKRHQATIARLRIAHTAMAAAGRQATQPLVMLAQGDSWFDYPLNGNSLALSGTDIIAELETMGTINPVIANIAHYGDTSIDEMSLPKQQRMLQMLHDPSNWLGQGKPDAILISAGGNDVAGDQFCIFLNEAATSPTGLSTQRYDEALDMVEASYRDLFEFRDRHAPGVPIFAHCYDFPLPTGTHPSCVGPWLKPSLDFTGWNFTDGTAICREALVRFRTRLAAMAADAANLFMMVDTQGVLTTADWANELHPFPTGFKNLAARFVTALSGAFPGRI
jgi:hypothetical protein